MVLLLLCLLLLLTETAGSLFFYVFPQSETDDIYILLLPDRRSVLFELNPAPALMSLNKDSRSRKQLQHKSLQTLITGSTPNKFSEDP